MKRSLQILQYGVFALLTLFCVLHADHAFASLADDTSFFTTSVPPNVLVVVDNSGSMNEVVWHPLYHPNAVYNTTTCPYVPYANWEFDENGKPKQEYWKCLKAPLCNVPIDSAWKERTSNTTATINTTTYPNCVSGRTIFYDTEVKNAGNNTRWSDGYLRWYLSKNVSELDVLRDPVTGEFVLDASGKAQASTKVIYNNILLLGNGTRSSCLGGGTYALYKRARVTAVKHVLRDIICQANQTGKVRFGLAKFDLQNSDPWGGFITVPVDDYTSTQATALESAITTIEGETWTPLAETLYYVYRYFMGRTNASIPFGANGTTRFPVYDRNTSGTTSGTIPGSPIQYTCQRSFVIYLTDGEPTNDHFGGTSDSKFTTFKNLIGDYNANNTYPEKAPSSRAASAANYQRELWKEGSNEYCATGYTGGCTSVAWFMDDVAMFMQENDARPDLAGVQNVETYTVGFTTTTWANAILQKTAEGPYQRDLNGDGDFDDVVNGKEETVPGNGKFFYSNNAEELTDAINKALADILNKTQFFTAATVPATRTTANNNFYASFFKPRKDTQFWEGHVVNYSLYLDGSILDKDNNCALLDEDGNPYPVAEYDADGNLIPGTLCSERDGYLPTENWNNAWWDAGAVLKLSSPDPAASDVATRRTLYYVPKAGLSFGATPSLFVEGTVTATDLGLSAMTAAEATTYQNAGSEITGTTSSDITKVVAELVWHMRGCTFRTARSKASCTKRENMLGDVFHANPLLVGPPSSPITDISYKEFRADYKSRYDRLFVASNDGFLHAFDAGPSDDTGFAIDNPTGHGSGKELWGFMPYEARARVKTIPGIGLANTSARSGVSDAGVAEYFVDGSPQASDVWMYSSPNDTTKDKTEWMSMLMGGMRQGGRSYYALDITQDTPKYMWSFPAEGAVSSMPGPQVGHMGESWSEPVITRIRVKYGTTNNGLGSTGKGYERWVAIFGGGYSVKSDPNHISYDANSTEGRAIFVVDVKSGQVLAQKYFKASPTTADIANGAVAEMQYGFSSRPAVFDINFDGFADVIYIGDLGGNIWKWIMDLDCTTTLDQCIGVDTLNQVGENLGQPDWKFELFFQAPIYSVDSSLATRSDNSYRSFYEPVTGAFINRKVHLVAGTGNRANLGQNDLSPTSADNQRLYVFIDDAPRLQDYVRTSPATATSVPAIFGNNTIVGQPAPYSGYNVRLSGPVWLMQPWDVLSAGTTAICGGSLASAYAGYYITGEENERFITNPVIALGRVMIGSYVPAAASLADPCLTSGSAYLWAFDVDCGKTDLKDEDGNPTNKQFVGGGVSSDIVISTGPDKKPDCSGLTGNLKKLCEGFNEECQVKEYMVSGSGGLHNNCRSGRLDNKPRFKAWRVEQ